MEKIFVYGFGPYLDFKSNIGMTVIESLPDLPGVSTHIFDVTFDSTPFLTALNYAHPQYVIGLGQSPRRQSLYIETQAKNWIFSEKEQLANPIETNAASSIPLSLPLPLLNHCISSDDAGSYGCNFSMWICESWCRMTGGKCGFIHIPFDFEVSVVVSYLSTVVIQIQKGDFA